MKRETELYQENYVHSVAVCAHGVRAPHECKECADEPTPEVLALQRIHDWADEWHTKDDGHCFALSEVVAMCRAALVAYEERRA